MLQQLHMGQRISADFGAGTVSVDSVAPCCAIVDGGAAPFDPVDSARMTAAAKPVDPCCNITGIDGETGIVTAKETATGRVFRFKAASSAMLQQLHMGQRISADFGAGTVSVNSAAPCCAIVGGGAEPFDPVDSARMTARAKPANPNEPPNGERMTARARPSDPLEPPQGQKATASAKPLAPCCGIHAYEVDGVDVALMSVERTNPNEITVRWQYRNTTGEPRNLGESFHGMGSSEGFSLVWDAYVVDPIGRVKYKILKDTEGTPVGSRHGGRKVVTLAGNGTTSVWAKFPVAASVVKLTVNLPGTEPFENVVVSEIGRE